MRGTRPSGRILVLVVLTSIAAVLPLVVAGTPAGAQVTSGKPGTVSPRLAELAERADDGPSTDRADNLAVDLAPSGPGSLLRAEGDLLVNVRFAAALTPLDEARLRAAGARIVATLPADGLAGIAIPASAIDAIAAVRGVASMEEVLEPRVGRTDRAIDRAGLARALEDGGATTNATCAPVISEGDVQLAAASARSTFGVDGTGVIVGVLSDSYDNLGGAAADVAAGELPGSTNPCGRTTPVQVQSDLASGGSDEGRAMAQVIHDLAPGATIRMATAFQGDVDFANQIRNLAAAGAKVIVDDITYLNEPMYQDGVIAKAIVDVTAAGVTYYSSAGNGNLRVGSADIAGYEAPAYRSSASCPTPFASGSYTCHDWDPGAGTDTSNSITLEAGETVQVRLGWNQPQLGITTDLDLALLDAGGTQVVASSEADNLVGQTASEILAYTNSTGASRTLQLVVARYSSPGTPRFRFVFQDYSGAVSWEWSTPGAGDTVGPVSIGHNMMRGAGSIAAIRYNATTAPEAFSSRGPATYCWNPVSGTTAASALPACVAVNPTLTATNGAANSFFGQLSSGVWRFFGTSQSAPHAAAIAALQVQARPCRGPAEVLAAQQASALAIGSFTAAAVGAGRVQAPGSISNLTACVPGAPTGVTGVALDGRVDLSWTAPASNGGSSILGYRVTPYIGAVAQTSTTSNVATTSRQILGLTNGTTYTFRVAAINAQGPGADSAPSAALTPVGVPGAPTNVTVAASDRQVAVAWTAPASDGGSAIQGYVVRGYVDEVELVTVPVSAPATTKTINGLTNGTTYTFRVSAINAQGGGPASAPSAAATPLAVPAAPTNVIATRGNGQVQLAWDVPVSDGGTPITGYRVTPSIGGVAQTPITFTSTATTQTITGLSNGTAYGFRVAAINAVGTGADSSPSAAVTPRTVPGPPTSVTGTPGDGQVVLSWTAPLSDGGSAITGYRVTPYIGATPQTPVVFGTSATTRTITALTNGTAYTFRVAATNGAGTSAESAPSASVTPSAAVIPFAPFASWSALVTRIHTDLIGVAPSTTARDAYVARLSAGSLTVGGLVAELRASADNTGNVDPVTRLYRAYFLRIPDRGGLTYWIRQRRVNGKKLNAISDSFAGSSEFRTKYGSLTNREFVELVYVNVLGRAGEQSGVDFWTSRLDRKVATRGQVMTGFSESNEYKRKQVAEVDVSVLFILLLGRAPTTTEFTQLVTALEAPTTTLDQVAAQLISSSEYATRVG